MSIKGPGDPAKGGTAAGVRVPADASAVRVAAGPKRPPDSYIRVAAAPRRGRRKAPPPAPAPAPKPWKLTEILDAMSRQPGVAPLGPDEAFRLFKERAGKLDTSPTTEFEMAVERMLELIDANPSRKDAIIAIFGDMIVNGGYSQAAIEGMMRTLASMYNKAYSKKHPYTNPRTVVDVVMGIFLKARDSGATVPFIAGLKASQKLTHANILDSYLDVYHNYTESGHALANDEEVASAYQNAMVDLAQTAPKLTGPHIDRMWDLWFHDGNPTMWSTLNVVARAHFAVKNAGDASSHYGKVRDTFLTKYDAATKKQLLAVSLVNHMAGDVVSPLHDELLGDVIGKKDPDVNKTILGLLKNSGAQIREILKTCLRVAYEGGLRKEALILGVSELGLHAGSVNLLTYNDTRRLAHWFLTDRELVDPAQKDSPPPIVSAGLAQLPAITKTCMNKACDPTYRVLYNELLAEGTSAELALAISPTTAISELADRNVLERDPATYTASLDWRPTPADEWPVLFGVGWQHGLLGDYSLLSGRAGIGMRATPDLDLQLVGSVGWMTLSGDEDDTPTGGNPIDMDGINVSAQVKASYQFSGLAIWGMPVQFRGYIGVGGGFTYGVITDDCPQGASACRTDAEFMSWQKDVQFGVTATVVIPKPEYLKYLF